MTHSHETNPFIFSDTAKNTNYIWDDAFTPVNYRSTIENVGKYGMLNKNTGKWAFKNSLTYKARGLCSRAGNSTFNIFSAWGIFLIGHPILG